MSTQATIDRLQALKRSYEAARDTEQVAAPASIATQHALYMRGLNDGVQLAIDAIDAELRIIAAGQVAAQHQ